MNRYGYRRYSDSTLMSLTKREIIELLRVAEHNYFVTDEALDNSAKAGRELAEKLDKQCGRVFVNETLYCPKCGAKMDLKDGKSNERY